MDYINCEVLTGDDTFVGHMSLYAVPRKGEIIWFSEYRNGHTAWKVEEVCHHVGDGNFGSYLGGYQSVVIYAKPVEEEG